MLHFIWPPEVLRLKTVPVPEPGQIRRAVHACGLAPADWAPCRGLFADGLPRGIGVDVAGTVEAVRDGPPWPRWTPTLIVSSPTGRPLLRRPEIL